MKNLEIEIEKIKTKVDFLIKIKEELNNRISFINEKIGEIRSSLVDKEREINEIKASIEKTIKIVEGLEPEEILKKFSETEAKIEVIKAKIESNEAILKKIVEELKDIRVIYFKFKSFEELDKINQETKRNVTEMKKIESKVFSTSTKVESIFSEINKRFKDFLEIKKEVLNLQENFKNIIKEINEIKILSDSFIKKGEIVEIEKKIESIKNLEENIENKLNAVKIPEEVIKISEELENFKKDKENFYEKMRIIEDYIYRIENVKREISRLDFNDFVKKDEIEKLENNLLKYLMEIDKLKEEISKISPENQKYNYENLTSRIEILEEKIEETNKNISEILNLLKIVVEE
ncbi:MAG: hypothetical protein QW038_02855 [Nanopusillaceae archaeon]